MIVTFGAYVHYGKLDSSDYEVDVDVTEEEFRRVIESAKTHDRFSEDDSVKDIYDKVYAAALALDLNEIKRWPDLYDLADRMASHLGISEEEAETRNFSDEEITEMLENEGIRRVSYPVNIEEYLPKD